MLLLTYRFPRFYVFSFSIFSHFVQILHEFLPRRSQIRLAVKGLKLPRRYVRMLDKIVDHVINLGLSSLGLSFLFVSVKNLSELSTET